MSYDYWCKIWKYAPELACICHARRTLNFQHCTLCVEGNAAVAAALKSGDKDKIAETKCKRASHHGEARSERLGYHGRREDGRDPASDSVSIILDKWDSAKCTVPYFARKPGGWWNVTSQQVLAQHVLGVMVHATPQNKVHMYTFNDSVAGGANNNVEGLRRTLAAEYATKPMPRIMYVQADNASDNKNFTVLLFLGLLVYHDYVADAYISFLLVGHTHEDIDALFSVISRHFRQIPGHSVEGKTPQSFQEEMGAALAQRFVAECHIMESVLDWDGYLRPHLHRGTSGMAHVDLEAEPESGARAPHRFWIHRREKDGAVVLHYKELDTHPIWLPSIDPSAETLVSNPDGIELFASPPPDPMGGSLPSEVELRTKEVKEVSERTAKCTAAAGPASKKPRIAK